MKANQATNAQIDAAIYENLRRVHYGQVLGSRGVPVVVLDDNGRLRRYEPDGTSEPLDADHG